MRDRPRICKYRHIYKRKGSPERRTNAALRGNQSGEIPTVSDRKISNEVRVHHSTRVCGARRGHGSTAALLSPQRCWYIYHLIIEVVCLTITVSSSTERRRRRWRARRQQPGTRWTARCGAIASALPHCITRRHARTAFGFYLSYTSHYAAYLPVIHIKPIINLKQ